MWYSAVMEPLILWSTLIFMGLMALLSLVWWMFPALRPRSGSERRRPVHDSETAEGQRRHEERMKGLRSLAADVRAQDNAPAEQDVAEQDVAEQDVAEQDVAEPMSGHW